MFVAKQFDIIMGVDTHIVQPPGPVPPVPIPHPFIGIVFDPPEFVPIFGASILVNGIPRAQAGTKVKNTVPHIPIGGTFVKPPMNEGEIQMGSITIIADWQPCSFSGLPVYTCQDVGKTAPIRKKRKSSSKTKGLVLPTSILLAVPKGGINGVGGIGAVPTETKSGENNKAKNVDSSKDFNQAMNKALKWLQKRGFKAEKPKIGKFGNTKGKPIGMQSADGKIGYRIEFDARNGAHINVWSGKEKGPHFCFGNASARTVAKIQRRLFQR